MCVYVCMYVCTCVYVYMCVCVFACVCVYFFFLCAFVRVLDIDAPHSLKPSDQTHQSQQTVTRHLKLKKEVCTQRPHHKLNTSFKYHELNRVSKFNELNESY